MLVKNMAECLPGLDDKALVTLRDNALRLSREGSEAQRLAADTLLPCVQAEIAVRGRQRIPAARGARKVPATKH